MTPQDQQKLENLIHQAVQGLPARRAPASLEARVQAEVLRRATLPWWRKSFSYWPGTARVGFLVICGGVIGSLFSAIMWITSSFDAVRVKAALAPEVQSLHTASRLLGAAGDFVGTVLASIPALWLYGAAAVVVALYLALFGIGAAAYRTLYASS